MMDSLISKLKVMLYEFLVWLVDVITALLDLIPVPDFINNIPDYASALPSSMLWFMSLFEIKFGLGVIVTALIARYVVSLIPFIGSK